MDNKQRKIVKKLAYHSFSIVKLGTAGMLLCITIISYVLKVQLSFPIVGLSFLVIGIYVGYVIAYYSIKYLREEEIKKKLPLN